MKRLLLISRCPPYPLHLGDRLIVHHLARELRARRWQIDLLAFASRPQDQDELPLYSGGFAHVELIPEPRRGQMAYLRRALLPAARWPRRAEQSWSPAMWRAIQARLSSGSYDAVHLFGGVQVYEFHRALDGLPAIITPYESYSLYLRRALDALPPGLSAARARLCLERRMARSFEAWMFAPYRQVVVVSDRDRDELLDINPALPVTVIPNGVDLAVFRRARIRRRLPALVFVGNYDYAPNVDAAQRLALDILPQVQKRIPDVKLWLVGSSPPPALRALAGESVCVTGRVPDVRPYLARASAFVCPLRLGAGIKNKVLEALALGCPVIATPLSVDGIAVTDGESALIAEGSALAESVVRLLRDPGLQRRLADGGRALIESRYSWPHVADLYEALYAPPGRERAL